MGNVRRGSVLEFFTGRRVRAAKTVAESDVYLFAGITGDFHPNHVDEAYCRTTPLGRRVAHGALLVGYMSMASTRITEGFEAPIVSQGYDRIRFLKPVYIGDTIAVDYEVADVDPDRGRVRGTVTVTNEHGDVVAVATHLLQLL